MKNKTARISVELDNELTRYADDINKSKVEASREIAKVIRGIRSIKGDERG